MWVSLFYSILKGVLSTYDLLGVNALVVALEAWGALEALEARVPYNPLQNYPMERQTKWTNYNNSWQVNLIPCAKKVPFIARVYYKPNKKRPSSSTATKSSRSLPPTTLD